MTIETRIFGEITIDSYKIIHFENGIIGFPELTDFALVYDIEKGNEAGVRWMQSLQEPNFALPVMDPLIVKADYNPEVDEDVLKPIGMHGLDEILALVTVTVPKDLTKMTVNLKAPMIINVAEKKAVQIILDSDSYQVKYPIYEILKAGKEGTC